MPICDAWEGLFVALPGIHTVLLLAILFDNCVYQILWGGRWQEGAAFGAGEDMEQLFSYLYNTTKSMNASGMFASVQYNVAIYYIMCIT